MSIDLASYPDLRNTSHDGLPGQRRNIAATIARLRELPPGTWGLIDKDMNTAQTNSLRKSLHAYDGIQVSQRQLEDGIAIFAKVAQ